VPLARPLAQRLTLRVLCLLLLPEKLEALPVQTSGVLPEAGGTEPLVMMRLNLLAALAVVVAAEAVVATVSEEAVVQ
jgi:hypothetical protein